MPLARLPKFVVCPLMCQIQAFRYFWPLWWYRIVPYRSYVKGWKISPRHYLNQDLAQSGSTNR